MPGACMSTSVLQPARVPRRTFLWSAAFGFVGFAGALLAGPAVVVGLVADRGRKGWQVALGFVVAQLPWVVPGLFVSTQDVHLAGAENFATEVLPNTCP